MELTTFNHTRFKKLSTQSSSLVAHVAAAGGEHVIPLRVSLQLYRCASTGMFT